MKSTRFGHVYQSHPTPLEIFMVIIAIIAGCKACLLLWFFLQAIGG